MLVCGNVIKNAAVETVAVMLRVWEVRGSDLDPEIDCFDLGFSSVLSAGMVPEIMTISCPSTAFPVNCSLTALSFVAVNSVTGIIVK
jgi:hypothetical protein